MSGIIAATIAYVRGSSMLAMNERSIFTAEAGKRRR